MLYAVAEEHAETFLARLSEQGPSLPGLLREEIERYLRCGRLEEPFVRMVCTGSRHVHHKFDRSPPGLHRAQVPVTPLLPEAGDSAARSRQAIVGLIAPPSSSGREIIRRAAAPAFATASPVRPPARAPGWGASGAARGYGARLPGAPPPAAAPRA